MKIVRIRVYGSCRKAAQKRPTLPAIIVEMLNMSFRQNGSPFVPDHIDGIKARICICRLDRMPVRYLIASERMFDSACVRLSTTVLASAQI